jgi:hypothetical protein
MYIATYLLRWQITLSSQNFNAELINSAQEKERESRVVTPQTQQPALISQCHAVWAPAHPALALAMH